MKILLIKLRRSEFVTKTLEMLFFLAGKLPVQEKTIVFESFLGKQYSDSPKALYLYIKENYPEYKLYWSFDRKNYQDFEGKNLNRLSRFGLKWILVMGRAQYWITNSRLPLWIPKPNHTNYLQTWHGTPLKRLATDMEEVHMPGTNTKSYKRNFLTEAQKWDFLISPNAYSTKIFKRAFQFEKEILEMGYPRNDYLLNHNNEVNIKLLKGDNNLPADKKIILYAPTWRDDQFHSVGRYKFDLHLDLDLMRKELGDEYIVLLRLHYLIADKIDLSRHKGFVYDFSFHSDISELYLISDLLITDYSSVFFDYANLKRPMIFYTYDIENYRDNLRGFYFDFETKAPGPLIKTTVEIIREIKKIKNEGYTITKNIEEFNQKFCYLEDGNASKRVVEKLLGH